MGSFLNDHLCEVRRGLESLKQKSNTNMFLIMLLVSVVVAAVVVCVVMYVVRCREQFDFDSFLDDDDFDSNDDFDALAATDEDFEK